ncbi:MAG: trigger factor [Clostridiales bacterium]|nr:trigger factor [Clostridiales bacterium]
MKKKVIAASLTLALAAVTMAGCGNSKSAEESTTEAQSETVVASSSVDYSQGLNEDGTLEGDDGSLVTLCDYSSIDVSADEISVTSDEVQEEIDSILENYETTSEVTDREVEDGDVVNIDYVGTLDGEEFDGGSAEGYDLTIGSGTFVEGFEDQLIGHTPGETVEVNITFPDDYSSEDLAGQDAVFTTTINYISETEAPELTDDFVTENLTDSYGYTSVKNMKKQIRKSLKNNKIYNYVWEYMLENCEFEEIPEDMVNTQLDVMIDQLEYSLSSQGYTLDTYLSSYGYEDEDALRDAYYSSCEEMVKSYLIADAVAAELGLEADDETVSDYFSSNYGTDDYSDYISYYSAAYVNRSVLNNSVTLALADNVVETE